MIEHVATDIGEFTNAVVKLTRAYGDSQQWWRGQADSTWGLVPSLYRQGLTSKEVNINARFLTKAKTRYVNCPAADDAFSWLLLMQHYRLPTRLLDWSESPLVALYFATVAQTDDGTDAAVWALSPTALNLQQRKSEGICMPGVGDIRQLSQEAFSRRKKTPNCRILSVLTEQSDLRHMVQQSVVTIHGCGTSISELPDADDYLGRIRIPGKAKVFFRQVLSLFGVSRAVLFPDLENLAAEVASLDFVMRAEQTAASDSAKRVGPEN